MHQILVQGIGYIALCFVIFSFQKNKRIHILFIMLSGLLLFVVHYSLLHAWTGAVMNFIEAWTVFVAYKKETEIWAQWKYRPFLFILLFLITGYGSSQGLIDMLPIIAQIFGTIAVWQTKPTLIRYIMLIPRPLRFIYNAAVWSYAGVIAEVCIFVSVVVSIIRFDILHVSCTSASIKKIQGDVDTKIS